MTSHEYSLLKSIHDCGGTRSSAFVHQLDSDQLAAFHTILRAGFVSMTGGVPDGFGGMMDFSTVSITERGSMALAEEQDSINRHAEEMRISDKRYRRDARRSWFQLFVSLLVGWILGLLTPIDVWKLLSDLASLAK